ncbi:MAG: DUF3253 domain-containing protein [Alphaproteobacteria bacterium]|nr:DUF3253 domain-containing protein [Alphaproteobacteria bacterium]
MTSAPLQHDSPDADAAPSLESVILRLCAEIGAGKTICPSEAAKAMALETGGGELAWRDWLLKVRRSAVGLAHAGQLVIYRKGKPVDPDDFRGVYRLGLPRSE